MDMRSLGNGLHSRGPSQSNISDLQFDDSASHHSASVQQQAGAALQSSLNGALQSPSKDSEPLDVLSHGCKVDAEPCCQCSKICLTGTLLSCCKRQ